MEIGQIVQLMDAMAHAGLDELDYQEGNLRLVLRRNVGGAGTVEPLAAGMAACTAGNGSVSGAAPAGAAASGSLPSEISGPASAQSPVAPVVESTESETVVFSPLVGTFYRAPSEEAEPFVQVGDPVRKGQVLGIIETMKLMNEIECEKDGVVTAVLAENEQVVEYGQPLFRIG